MNGSREERSWKGHRVERAQGESLRDRRPPHGVFRDFIHRTEKDLLMVWLWLIFKEQERLWRDSEKDLAVPWARDNSLE